MKPSTETDETVTDALPPQRAGVVFPRLWIGLIVLICTEVFSGASLPMGLWNPWVWLVTYWLYFAHFFFFTTLAVRTGRTSLSSLYLWGVLFGLYESWITKVIWSGYGGDGTFAVGAIGPYGLSEISMVFIFHPVAAFILPLSVVCLLYPSLRRFFPDLAWFTGTGKGARAVQVYLIFSLVPIMAVNSGGPVNLVLNLAFVLALLFTLSRRARVAFTSPDARPIVVFGRWGIMGLCLYLVVLYGLAYRFIRYEALPSIPVQLLTFLFYGLAIGGLWLHPTRTPRLISAVQVAPRELRLVKNLFGLMLGLGLALSCFSGTPEVFLPVVPNFVIWTFLGFFLTMMALVHGVRARETPLRRY